MSWLSFEVCRRNQHLLFLILPLSVAAIPNASFEFSLELQKAASIALSGCSRRRSRRVEVQHGSRIRRAFSLARVRFRPHRDQTWQRSLFISDDVQTLVSLGDYVLGCDFHPDHDRSVSTGVTYLRMKAIEDFYRSTPNQDARRGGRGMAQTAQSDDLARQPFPIAAMSAP